MHLHQNTQTFLTRRSAWLEKSRINKNNKFYGKLEEGRRRQKKSHTTSRTNSHGWVFVSGKYWEKKKEGGFV